MVIGPIASAARDQGFAHRLPPALVPSLVATLAWGDDVALTRLPGSNQGPHSLAEVESSREILVLDAGNNRLVVLDAAGGLLSPVPLSRPAHDLTVDGRGRIWLLDVDLRSVQVMGRDGAVLTRYALPVSREPLLGIDAAGDGTVWLQRADQVSLGLTAAAHAAAGPSAAGFPQALGRVVDPGTVVVARVSPRLGRLQTLDARGREVTAFPIEAAGRRIETLTYLGSDREGHHWLVVETSGPEGAITRHALEYSGRGEVLAEGKLPYSVFAETFRDVRLSIHGALLQLVPMRSGLAVVRWTVGPPDAPRPPPLPVDLFSATRPRPDDVLPGDGEEPPGPGEPTTAVEDAAIPRDEMLARANAYLLHTYTVGAANLTPPSGTFCGGKLVITPSWLVPGLNTSIPYKWGGFSGLAGVTRATDCDADFDAALSAGRFAGDVETEASFGTCCAAGVDCSGFVSQCWDLPSKRSTRTLPELCCTLPSFENLELGDALNRYNAHVRLFWRRESNGSFSFYEASGAGMVRTGTRGASDLTGYLPLRYAGAREDYEAGHTVIVLTTQPLRSCPGAGCEVVATPSAGSRGMILAGPQYADGTGWYEIALADRTVGWLPQCLLVCAVVAGAPAVSVAATTQTSVTLTWAATDCARDYVVERDGEVAGTTTTLGWTDSGLAPATRCCYTVRGRNCADGPTSTPVCATTSSRLRRHLRSIR